MNSADSIAQIRFPTIARVKLDQFDLYNRRPNTSLKVDHPVFCLIGANGLGKSTFLNTLMYGITGGLPYRVRGFQSAPEYLTEATRKDRRIDYYGGRLSDDALEVSSVTIELHWTDFAVEVTRPIFNGDGISSLRIREKKDKEFSDVELPRTDLDDKYKSIVVDCCGLNDFSQFFFLMHYVCLFDEERHLLLWASSALTNALYLAFGSDVDEAAKANDLRRDVERYGSRGRNDAFAARKARDSAAELQRVLDGNDDEDEDEEKIKGAKLKLTQLNNQLDEAKNRLHRKDTQLSDANTLFHNLSAALTELRLEYDEVFAKRTHGVRILEHHPLIRTTLHDDLCAICGAKGIAHTVRTNVERGVCPLCQSEVKDQGKDEGIIEHLKNLDNKIETARDKLDNAIKRRKRLKDEYETAFQAEDAARKAIDAFLEDNSEVVKRLLQPSGGTDRVNEQIKHQLAEADRFKSASLKNYQKRNEARDMLLKIERGFKARFEQHSDHFVNLFRAYAEKFIGLTVDIELKHRGGRNDTGFELLLSLEGQLRSVATDVSESQRFFLDIALRMALTEFMSETAATLMIDTPEGSLDISYEARAGEMFSNFTERRNFLLMTANLRSSALLKRLAERQKMQGMQIERMTDWTDLSDVQREEENLFVEAYKEIEKAMK